MSLLSLDSSQQTAVSLFHVGHLEKKEEKEEGTWPDSLKFYAV